MQHWLRMARRERRRHAHVSPLGLGWKVTLPIRTERSCLVVHAELTAKRDGFDGYQPHAVAHLEALAVLLGELKRPVLKLGVRARGVISIGSE